MSRKLINPDELPTITDVDEDASSPSGYNYAIIENGNFHMAGQVARDSEGNTVGDDIVTQGTQVYKNIGYILDEIDKDFSDVVKVNNYFANIERDMEIFKAEVWPEFFDDPYPAHTGLEVSGFSQPEFLLETEVDIIV